MTTPLPPGIQLEKVDDRIMTLNVGPQHPGSGHMRLIIKVDGDYIVSCDPDPGYVHRGEEKMAEYRNYIQNIPHLERPVIHDSCNILYPYCLAVEELLGIEVPERAKYIRVIASDSIGVSIHFTGLQSMASSWVTLQCSCGQPEIVSYSLIFWRQCLVHG